jgi:hypothetical protein
MVKKRILLRLITVCGRIAQKALSFGKGKDLDRLNVNET